MSRTLASNTTVTSWMSYQPDLSMCSVISCAGRV